MHYLKFQFTGFFKVFTQYALILRRSVFVLLKFISDIPKQLYLFCFHLYKLSLLYFFDNRLDNNLFT
jgi:hypothetical protein